MTSLEPLKIKPNQNLLGLMVGLSALGAAEHYNLPTLFWFSVVISIIMVASIASTTLYYTIDYCKEKKK